MSKIRLDNMKIDQVRDLYNPMFEELLSSEELDEIYEKYKEKYNEMKSAEEEGYEAPSGMGRGYKYLKNILYGWYIEELFYLLIKQNPNVENIEFTGDDSEHNFKYDRENKKITIEGAKTTKPDFLITIISGSKIYMELKTAAAEVFSIKTGNMKQLNKTMGYTGIYSLIIMVDLVNRKYEIKDLAYFLNTSPFVNQRMEGQICYDFPVPEKDFSLIKNENFESYIDNTMFEHEAVKKYKLLSIAEKTSNKKIKKEIDNKIKLEEKRKEMKLKIEEYEEKINKILEATPNIDSKTWDEYLLELTEE